MSRLYENNEQRLRNYFYSPQDLYNAVYTYVSRFANASRSTNANSQSLPNTYEQKTC